MMKYIDKQIRFCPGGCYSVRDDDFEINKDRNNEDKLYCPVCSCWLWSLVFDHDIIEITDWDEHSIYFSLDDFASFFRVMLSVFNEELIKSNVYDTDILFRME